MKGITGTKSLNATMIWNSKPSSIGFTFTVIRVTIYWMDLLVVNGYNLFKIMLRVRPSATNLLKWRNPIKRVWVVHIPMYILMWTTMNRNLWHVLRVKNYFVPVIKFIPRQTRLFLLKVVHHQRVFISLVVMPPQCDHLSCNKQAKGNTNHQTTTTYVIICNQYQ